MAGASGYAGGELLRLLLGHPEVEIGAAARALQRRAAARSLQPHLVPLADRVLEPTTAEVARRARRRLPRAAARRVGRASPSSSATTCSSSTAARTSGSAIAEDWAAVLRRRARRHLAVRPARAARCPRTRWRRQAGRGPRLLPDRRRRSRSSPRCAAGLVEPDVVVVAAVGHLAARARPLKPHLLGSEVMGALSAVRRRRRAPAHPRDRARTSAPRPAHRSRSPSPRCWRRCRAASSPPARPGSRPASPPTTCGRRTRRRTPTSRSCTCCRRASGRRPRRVLGANTVLIQVAVDERAGRVVAVSAIDNLVKGTAGGAVQCMNIALGLPETTGPDHHRSRAMSVTAAAGFAAAGVTAGLKSCGGTGPRARASTTGPRTPRPPSSPPTGARPPRCCGREQVVRTASSTRSSSTPAAPTAAPARTASRPPTPPPRRSPRLLGHRRGRRRGLLHRADRPALPMDRLLAGVDAAAAPWQPTAATTPPRDHDHRHRQPSRSVVDGDGWTRRRHGQGRGHARARPRHDARRPHHRRRRGRGRRCDAALRAATRVDLRPGRLRRLHVDQRHRAAAGVRRVGRRADRAEFAEAVTRVCADLAQQLIADAEGATTTSRSSVRRRGHRGRRRRGGPLDRPQQPLQGGRLRRRPQLGPGARRDRHDRRGLRPGRPRRRDQRRVGVPRRRRPASDRDLVDLRAREVTSPSTSTPATRRGDDLDQRPHRTTTSTRTARTPS